MSKTKVIFRQDRKKPYEIFAMFPQENGNSSPYTCQYYASIGQHSHGDVQIMINQSRPAKFEDYKPLKDELINIIDYDLDVCLRATRQDYAIRAAKLKVIGGF